MSKKFAQDLKPILIVLLICFGIDLDRSKKRSKHQRVAMISIGLFWFVCVNIPVAVLELSTAFSANLPNSTRVADLNFRFSYAASSILVLVFNCSILMAVLFSWKPLWKQLKRLQEGIGDENVCHHQLHRNAIQAVSVIVTVRYIHSPKFHNLWKLVYY